jgi:hypothetical protein
MERYPHYLVITAIKMDDMDVAVSLGFKPFDDALVFTYRDKKLGVLIIPSRIKGDARNTVKGFTMLPRIAIANEVGPLSDGTAQLMEALFEEHAPACEIFHRGARAT